VIRPHLRRTRSRQLDTSTRRAVLALGTKSGRIRDLSGFTRVHYPSRRSEVIGIRVNSGLRQEVVAKKTVILVDFVTDKSRVTKLSSLWISSEPPGRR
jgi:hypothetical protein